MTNPVSRWYVSAARRKIFGNTKKECLNRAASFIQERKDKGLGYSLKQEFIFPRTKRLPIVLIICRDFDGLIRQFNAIRQENGIQGQLEWTDSCGTRSVYWYHESSKNWNFLDYEEDALDLPLEVFQSLKTHLENEYGGNLEYHPHFLFMRREDPGTGIIIPELDHQMLKLINDLNLTSDTALKALEKEATA